MNLLKMNFKDYNTLDIALVKAAVFFATLFLVSLVPEFAQWVTGTHWAIFLVIAVLLAIKPLMKAWK
ncbi:MAG: hypothetical protein V1493_05775 [Candidatus Diapherotrites archaeon]